MNDEQKSKQELIDELAQLRERNQVLETRLASLRINDTRFRALFNQSKDLVTIFDLDQYIKNINPRVEDLTGFKSEDVIGKHLRNFLTDVEGQDAAGKNKQVLAGKSIPIYERRIINPQGKESIVEVNLIPVKDENDQIYETISISRDIADRKLAEEQRIQLQVAQERNRILTQVVSHATHDLMTPLTSIKTKLYLLEKTTDEAERQNRLTQINIQITRLQDMIQDIITLNRLDNLRFQDFPTQAISLTPFVEATVEKYLPEFESKNITCAVNLPDDNISVAINVGYLNTALKKLLENAINFTPSQGQITVSLETGARTVHIHIQDSGIGISEDDLPRIFEHFYRAEKHRPADKGMGLGLTIAKSIVNLHRGNITVSPVEDGGSIFTISLPQS